MLRAVAVGAALTAGGAFLHLGAKDLGPQKTEKWMEENLPPQVGKYTFRRSTTNPQQSYAMDDSTYQTLKPYGIVCRKYSDGDRTFDVVVIASNNRASFHDPRVCFTAQGFNIEQQKTQFMSNGDVKIPYTHVDIDGAMGKSMAMYFYKTDQEYYPDTAKLKVGMLWNSLRGGNLRDGVFYRIIPESNNITEKDLETFALTYKKAAEEFSKGYF